VQAPVAVEVAVALTGKGSPPWSKPGRLRAYGFAWVTGILFLGSWLGQFAAQAAEVSNEAQQHGQAFQWSEFWPQFLASTFENWQSEFLQLIWQAAGLAFLYFWGSSQSRESDDRVEAKLDEVLERLKQ
jgi:hypothetical protein